MGIAEILTAVALLVGAVTPIVRELRRGNSMTRAQILGEAEQAAWEAVEATKRLKPGMSREEIWREFQKEALKYLTGKGIKRISTAEWNGMRDTAEQLSHAAKSAFAALRGKAGA